MSKTNYRRPAAAERDPLIRGSSRPSAAQRDEVDNLLTALPSFTPYQPSRRDYANLLEVSDLRTFDPQRNSLGPNGPFFRSPVSLVGTPARINAPARGPLSNLRFVQPKTIPICARRSTRKQVLHALKRTGKGTGHGRKTLNAYSGISCKG